MYQTILPFLSSTKSQTSLKWDIPVQCHSSQGGSQGHLLMKNADVNLHCLHLKRHNLYIEMS